MGNERAIVSICTNNHSDETHMESGALCRTKESATASLLISIEFSSVP